MSDATPRLLAIKTTRALAIAAVERGGSGHSRVPVALRGVGFVVESTPCSDLLGA